MTTTIALSEPTRDKLKAYGRKGETYDQIVRRMMEIVDRELYMREVHGRLEEKEKFIPLDELE